MGRSSVWAAGNSPTKMRTPGRSQERQGLNGAPLCPRQRTLFNLTFLPLHRTIQNKYQCTILFIKGTRCSWRRSNKRGLGPTNACNPCIRGFGRGGGRRGEVSSPQPNQTPPPPPSLPDVAIRHRCLKLGKFDGADDEISLPPVPSPASLQEGDLA